MPFACGDEVELMYGPDIEDDIYGERGYYRNDVGWNDQMTDLVGGTAVISKVDTRHTCDDDNSIVENVYQILFRDHGVRWWAMEEWLIPHLSYNLSNENIELDNLFAEINV